MASVYSRRWFVSRLGLIGCALPLTAYAQPVKSRRVQRIGFLIGPFPTLIKAFDEELRRLGHADGTNLIIERRVSGLTSDIAELAQMDLDLIVAAALPVALEVRKVNPAMPMVIATCPGMVSNGFAKSLKRPGGIYTGMDELPPGVTGKRLRLLKTAAPRVSRVALLSTTPGRGGHEAQLADAEKAAKSLGLTVKAYRAMSRRELEAALTQMVNDGMNGLLNFQGGLSLVHRELVVGFAEKNRLPAIYQSAFFVEAGGLMSWAPNQEEQFREATRYVDKIVRGANPGQLPVHFPSRYYLTLNQRVADGLGLVLPRALAAKADRVLL
ncbi:MAG TPA: ABC transporter substrate-binding protein [Pyrinomonadaceae bacterium]|nr:ABC transporter substrate-binding protein [Pyrinomonadaceae bacterium]